MSDEECEKMALALVDTLPGWVPFQYKLAAAMVYVGHSGVKTLESVSISQPVDADAWFRCGCCGVWNRKEKA